MKIDFYLRFHTRFGQAIGIVGNLPALGSDETGKALPLSFLNDEFWYASIEIDTKDLDSLHYHYVLIEGNEHKKEAEKHRIIDLKKLERDLVVIDTWNDESFVANAFYTAPLLSSNEVPCIIGNSETLGNWQKESPALLHKKGQWWTIQLEIPPSDFA